VTASSPRELLLLVLRRNLAGKTCLPPVTGPGKLRAHNLLKELRGHQNYNTAQVARAWNCPGARGC